MAKNKKIKNMNLKNLTGYSLLGLAFIATSYSGCREKVPTKFSNILWLTCEDNSPLLGCYGVFLLK